MYALGCCISVPASRRADTYEALISMHAPPSFRGDSVAYSYKVH